VTPLVEKLLDEVHGAWRYRWAGLAAAWLVAVLGWLYVFALPDNYAAQARVFVDTRTILRPALQGLAVNEDLNAEVNYVRQALLAGPQLLKVAHEAGMVAEGASPGAQAAAVEMLARNTSITVKSANGDEEEDHDHSAGNIYRIAYQDADRARALKVVGVLSHALVTGTVYSTQVESETAQKFLESQLKDYEQRLRASEARLADFKSQHLGVMPAESGGYFGELFKETQAIEDTQNKLRTAESRRVTLERQLRGDAAVSAAGSGGAGGGADTLTLIAQAQAHLDELLLRYTDKHPDVIAARAALADLKARRAAEVESLRRGDANAAAMSRASANPVYQGIALQLNQAEVDISDLKSELADHEAKAKELRAMLNTAPEVEAQYAQLARDYEVNKEQYTTMLGNYEKTRVGARANEAGSVRFTVVQPPTVGSTPVWPNRPLFLAGVLFLALLAGLGSAYGLNLLLPVAGSARALATLTGATVIGVVGNAFPSRSANAARRDRRRVYLAAGFLVAIFAAALLASNAGWRMSLPF
jgi:polysaccharide chain length determinant protein (PEP-CTERM system associated)